LNVDEVPELNLLPAHYVVGQSIDGSQQVEEPESKITFIVYLFEPNVTAP